MYSQPKKMTTKKKIELLVLAVIVIWFIVFAINYVRYNDSKSLIFAIHDILRKHTFLFYLFCFICLLCCFLIFDS